MRREAQESMRRAMGGARGRHARIRGRGNAFVDVRFYATLRPIVGGRQVSFDLPEGATAKDLLKAACERYPALGPLIWTDGGELGEYIKVFVDGRDIRYLQMLETPIPKSADVDIFPPAAGG